MTTGPRVGRNGVRVRMMWSRWWSGRRRPTAGMRVKKGRSQSRPAMGAGR